ncbi:MAG: hypothetical protein IT529_06210 [Burkholderiales bacterium]|nr:hypothetical protein [Burkholderiales bacterium]
MGRLQGYRTYIGIAILTIAGFAGVDPDAAVQAAGIEVEPDARAIAQALVVLIGAALAAYGRWKATQHLTGDSK